jgi:hypothetical protein
VTAWMKAEQWVDEMVYLLVDVMEMMKVAD